ncbi:hypothetical protein JCM6882_004514 [Rhodosporidiobolus microsporus]
MAKNSNQNKGGKKGGKTGGKDGRNKGAVYSSKRPVGGKGIFVTCVRGKESRCVGEMYDILEEVADRLYPAERVEKMVAAREAQRAANRAAGAADDEAMQDEEEDETEAVAAEAPAPAAVPVDDEDDIEASIARELAELAETGGRKAAPAKVKGGDKGKEKQRPRFQSIATDTECLVFIATAWPYDPVELVEAIVSEVQETGVSRTQVSQRLSPITFSCHSLSVEQVEAQSSSLIEKSFVEWAAANNKTSVTYAIEPSLRSHTAPLSRAVLLPLLGSKISSLSSPPTISSPVPSRGLLQVRADLKNPDLVVLPTVLKNVYGCSVVEGRLWRGKKFNLEEIAKEVRRRRLAEEEREKEEAKAKAAAQVEAAEPAPAAAPTAEAE